MSEEQDDQRFSSSLDEASVKEIQEALDQEEIIYQATLFLAALADSTRFKIILALKSNELCVSDMVELLGISQSAISHQLRLLKDRGVVRDRRDGRRIFYSLDDDHVSVLLNAAIEHVSHLQKEI